MKRRWHEQRATVVAQPSLADAAGDDRAAILFEELAKLPDHQRAVIVLCGLEGLTQVNGGVTSHSEG